MVVCMHIVCVHVRVCVCVCSSAFQPVLPHIQMLWELVLLGEVSSLASLKSRMVYLSGAGLPRFSSKKVVKRR